MSGTTASRATDIAVVGMTGRFPGADTVEKFWQNLVAGIEARTVLSDDDLLAAGVPPQEIAHPDRVKAGFLLNDIDLFDAGFFDYYPGEVELMDPQHRLFLECSWEALEHAGYDPSTYPGLIGVYAGTATSTYLMANLMANNEVRQTADFFQVMYSNDKDYLTTRVSYKLDLRGPSVVIQTACSTSLVAVHNACRGLLTYECDMAMAGGVSIAVPLRVGYRYLEGGVQSPDGRCRAFDDQALGTAFGHGVGVVVLKRLNDAIADGDHIHAVICGSAINNDGAGKIGYTAPSIKGQERAIKAAIRMAGIDPSTIGFVEAHGAGTPLGDPIEVRALTQAYRAGTKSSGYCAIGSVKTNVGHLNHAAGIGGFIKATLAVERGLIPASLNFTVVNREIDFSETPFFLNTAPIGWSSEHPRRAAINSLGIGGTNAHVIIEQAPAPQPSAPGSPWQTIVLSARSEAALERITERLAHYLQQNPNENLADVAFTLQAGRKALEYRAAFVCRDVQEAIKMLEGRGSGPFLTNWNGAGAPPVIFLFPGHGGEHLDMARELYREEAEFRRHVDECAEVLTPLLGLDIREMLYPQMSQREACRLLLDQTRLAHPALFAIEYSMARLWMSWGVRPSAMLGHSFGEYVAACIAEVLPLEDALALVTERARLLDETPPGGMLAVALNPKDAAACAAAHGASLAAVNGPSSCVLAGNLEVLARVEANLAANEIRHFRLAHNHGFHSSMVEPAVGPLVERFRKVRLAAPKIPYLSNVTGSWISAADATDPEYWGRHTRLCVSFSAGAIEALKDDRAIFVEMGPGRVLGNLVRQHDANSRRTIVASLPGNQEERSPLLSLMEALGQVWLAGTVVNWREVHGSARRQRKALPTYPFERQRYWIEPSIRAVGGAAAVQPRPTDGNRKAAEVRKGGAKPPAHQRPSLRAKYVAPATPIQIALTEAWEHAFGIAGIGIHDNFFDLGGHSVLATNLAARIRESLALELPLRALFEAPTIAELSERLAALTSVAGEPVVPALSAQPRPAHLPLSYAQERLWVLEQLGLVGSAYIIPEVVRLQGNLNVAALERSFAEVVRRHEVLRTRFEAEDGIPRQVIDQAGGFVIEVVDLTAQTEMNQRESKVRQLVGAEVARPFDLKQGPLLRTQLLRLGAEEHVLVVVMHHIVSDGWSTGVLIREIGALYLAYCQGRPSPLPELAIQYADYALWQRGWLRGEVLDRQLSYWKKQLSGMPAALELPTDRIRTAVPSYRGGYVGIRISADLTRDLNELARTEGATLYMALLAAFQYLLKRYSGQDDIVVGSPIAGRTQRELAGLIGFFVNTLVLRVDLSGTLSFRQLVQRVRKVALEAYDHQDLPFERLVEELNPIRDPSRQPLFQLLFAFHNTPQETLELPGLRFGQLGDGHAMSKFDLSVHMQERGDRIEGYVEYATDLFERATIERLVGYFKVLLQGIVADPDALLDELPLLDDAERHRLVEELNDTTADFPQDKCLQELFAEQVGLTPNAISVVHDDRQLSYAELDRRSSQLANFLRAAGVGPDAIVGLCIKRSPEMVIGLLGILKAGGAYLPLDPNYPAERLAYMLSTAKAAVLLTQASLVDCLPATEALTIRIDTDWPQIAQQRATFVASDIYPNNLAYIIYTSGSTGRPKAIAMPHRGLVNLINWQSTVIGAEAEGSRVIQFTSISFDVACQEIFETLATGKTLVLVDDEVRLDSGRLLDFVREHDVHEMFAPQIMLEQIAQEANERHIVDLPIREFFQGGEPLRLSPGIAKFLEVSKARLHNHYGPSETHVVSAFTVPPGFKGNAVPIGRPISNARLYVLDGNLHSVPIGVSGELYIGGVGLARGYQNRPDLTADRFVPSPFGDGERLYRTGDLSRYLLGGNLEFLGRIDLQVKLRGYRIELGEIEACLEEHPSILQAVVTAREDMPGDKRLVAYLVSDSGCPDTAVLRTLLKKRLPDYMVPAAFVVLDALPLSPNGKIDRKALPSPEHGAIHAEYVAPRNATEEALAEVWREVLKLDRVGIHDNFFEIGGHSLVAMRVMVRIRERAGVELPPRALFEAPTVQQLAEIVEQKSLERTPDDQSELIAFKEKLWLTVDQMSEEEVMAKLAELGENMEQAVATGG